MGLNHAGDQGYDISTHCAVYNLSIAYGTPPTNAWNHWAVTVDTNGTRFYINGELIGSRSGITQTYVAGTELGLGTMSSPYGEVPYTDSNVGYLDGYLDEVRIYNRALSTNEINLLYTGGTQSAAVSLFRQGNSLSLTLTGGSGYSYGIQSSSNLINWTDTGIHFPVAGVLQTNLPIGGSRLFYRAVRQ